jgi:hypothetical protein
MGESIVRRQFEVVKKACRIVRELGRLKKYVDPNMVDKIASGVVTDLDASLAILDLKKEISDKIEVLKSCHDTSIKIDLDSISNIDILNGILSALEWLQPESMQDAIDHILSIASEEVNYDNKVNAVVEYYELRSECIYPDVTEFINNNLDAVCKEEWCVEAINEVLRYYTKEYYPVPFPEEVIKEITDNLDYVDRKDFNKKSKLSLINLINSIFRSYCEQVPQIGYVKGKLIEKSVTPFK